MLNRVLKLSLFTLVMIVHLESFSACAAEKPVAGPAKTSRNPVVVVLRPHVEVDAKVIRLGDIATISGGDAMTRIKLMDLDLEDQLNPGQAITIHVRQIEFRLQLAGIDARQVAIRGDASRIRFGSTAEPVTRQVELTKATTEPFTNEASSEVMAAQETARIDDATLESAILKAAKECVMKRLPWPAENVDIRFAQVLPNSVRQAAAEGYQCSVEVKNQGPATGRVSLRVLAISAEKPPVDLSVIVDVRHFDDVVLMSKSFERGHVISAADVYVDRRDVTEMADYCSATKDVVGMTLRRPLRALSTIRKNDFEQAASKAETTIVVKRKEQVRMVAKLGTMVIEATGEAMQDGRIGDTIRLKNVDSNVILQGKVTGNGEVEIKY